MSGSEPARTTRDVVRTLLSQAFPTATPPNVEAASSVMTEWLLGVKGRGVPSDGEAVQISTRIGPLLTPDRYVRYNPRTATGIPTEPLGSLPQPARLQEAYAMYDAGQIDTYDLERLQDAAVKDSIQRFEATGSPIISDGEQRWSGFATYPIAETLAGTGLVQSLGPGGQFFAIFADGTTHGMPNRASGRFTYDSYAGDTLSKSILFATKPMKQSVVGPSILARLYPRREPIPDFSLAEFEASLIDECEKDIRTSFVAGAARVSVDVTDRLSIREAPRDRWAGPGTLSYVIELSNRVMARFTAEERANIGVHTCPVGDSDVRGRSDVVYADILGPLFGINAGYFLVTLAGERDRDPIYETIGRHVRSDADGVAQMAYLGTTVASSARVESPKEIAEQLIRAANFVPREQIGSTDDCGLSPSWLDEKPNLGSPDYAREVAFRKIEHRVEGTRRAAEKLGVG